jgi:hypothetical protein
LTGTSGNDKEKGKFYFSVFLFVCLFVWRQGLTM